MNAADLQLLDPATQVWQEPFFLRPPARKKDLEKNFERSAVEPRSAFLDYRVRHKVVVRYPLKRSGMRSLKSGTSVHIVLVLEATVTHCFIDASTNARKL